MSDGSIRIDSKLDSKQFDKDLQGMEKKLNQFGKNMEKWGKDLTKKVTLPIAGVFAGFAKAAMDLEATEAKYETVFEGMTDQADDFIKQFQKLTPATTAEARSMASGLQDLLIPMGMQRDAATDLTGDMFHLIGALTNFNSATHSAEDVSSAFQSALLGQYQPLQSLGIQLSKTEVQAHALSMGLASNADELTKADMAMAMYDAAMNQSGDALEAYTEENLDTWTQLNILKKEFIDIAADIGKHFLPIIEEALNFIRRFKVWLEALSDEQQKQIIMFMAIAAAIGPLLIIFGKLIQSVTAISGALSTAMIAKVAIIGVIALVAYAIYNLWTTNEDFRNRVVEMWEMLKEFFTSVTEGIRENFDQFRSTIESALTTISNIVEGVVIPIFMAMLEMFMSILPIIKDLFVNVFEIIGRVIDVFMYIIGEAMFVVKNWMEDNQVMLMLIQTQFLNLVARVREALDIFFSIIRWVLNKTYDLWDRYGVTVMAIVTNLFDTMIRFVRGAFQIISGILDVFIGVFTGDWARAWNGMGSIVTGVVNVIAGAINGLIGMIEVMINALANAVNRIPSFSIPSWVPGLGGNSFGLPNIPQISLPRIPKFDVGTDRITADGLAMVHKDEKIIPAKSTGPYTGKGETITHTGTIRLEGFSSKGEFLGAVEMLASALDDPRGLKILDNGIARMGAR